MSMIETIDELFGIYYATSTAYQGLDRYTESIELFEKALTLIEESNNDIAIVDTLMSLGISFLHIGDEKRASEYLGEAYEMSKEIGYDEVVKMVEREFMG